MKNVKEKDKIILFEQIRKRFENISIRGVRIIFKVKRYNYNEITKAK
jgi:hypothetical protein